MHSEIDNDLFDDDDYPLSSKLLAQLRREKILRDRIRKRKITDNDAAVVQNDYSVGAIWLVSDRKVTFNTVRKEEHYHDSKPLRPGVVLRSPDQETGFEVCWVPGSSRLDGANRNPGLIVVYNDTAYLPFFYEWYHLKTLEQHRGHFPPDKREELQKKSQIVGRL